MAGGKLSKDRKGRATRGTRGWLPESGVANHLENETVGTHTARRPGLAPIFIDTIHNGTYCLTIRAYLRVASEI